MNYDLISLLIFYAIVLIFFLKNREKFEIESKIIALYKTKFGLKLMDKFSKIRKRGFMNFISYIVVIFGFCGMLFIFFYLIRETLKFLVTPGAPPPLAPVLPGVKVPGVPALSFWHWIIAILIVAIVHEFSHGIFARFYNIKIKSSGFAFMGPILLAFVEPDENKLNKMKPLKQIAVYSAGPFMNVVVAGIILLLINFAFFPSVSLMYERVDGVIINNVIEGYPMKETNIEVPFVVKEINDKKIENFTDFLNFMKKVKPGDKLKIKTDKGIYEIVAEKNPKNESLGFIGVSGISEYKIKEKFKSFLPTINWVSLLLMWLFIINLGVGLFNLLPLGPVDGGRIFKIASRTILKNKKIAERAYHLVSALSLFLIFVNLIPWLIKLVKFIAGLI